MTSASRRRRAACGIGTGWGPDFFPLHLLQARRQLPNGQAIPLWLVWAMPAFWLAMLAAAAAAMTRR